MDTHDIVIKHNDKLTTIEVDGVNITEDGRVVEAVVEFTARDVPHLTLLYDCYYDNIRYKGKANVVHSCPQGKRDD